MKKNIAKYLSAINTKSSNKLRVIVGSRPWGSINFLPSSAPAQCQLASALLGWD